MEKMRSIQGELRAIQQKYKGDPLAMQREQTKLYQKHNINPLAGCLPQLLQIFMLFVFYQAILKLLKIESLVNEVDGLVRQLPVGNVPTFIMPLIASLVACSNFLAPSEVNCRVTLYLPFFESLSIKFRT